MAIHRARMLFPFPILGIDTDNGGGSSMRNWWHLVSKNTLLLPEDGLGSSALNVIEHMIR